MLYDLWCQVRDRQPDALALRELASGRTWSFLELDAATEQAHGHSALIEFPSGNDAEFVISVLRAWRHSTLLCPMDVGQTRPAIDTARLRESFPEIVHLKTTSASTGAAKTILFSSSQIAADANNIVATMGLIADSPNIGIISLAHSYGFSNLVTPLLLHGIPLVLAASQLPESFRAACASTPNATVAAVPALWRAWHAAGAIPRNLRLAISAGAALPAGLESSVYDSLELKIHNFCGASECGGIAYDRTSTPRTDAAGIGTALENVSLGINANGCLVVRGPAVGTAYWPEATPALSAGAFTSSDLATIADGQVRIEGRASDVINVAGRKLSPEVVERALSLHPEVKACLVLGMPDPENARSESVAAIVECTPGVAPRMFQEHLLRSLPPWQVPRVWHLVDSLDVNARGKLSRAEWRRRLTELRACESGD